MSRALALLLFAADGGTTLYSAATREPHGLVQLELGEGDRAVFRQVVSIHLPPAEVERLEVKVSRKGEQLCLTPKPKAVDACLVQKGAGLVARFKGEELVLERR